MHFDAPWKSLRRTPSPLLRLSLSALALALAGAAALRAQPLIEYRFDDPGYFTSGTVPNAQGEGFAGRLEGGASRVRGALGNAVDLNGTTGVVTTDDTQDLDFGSGLTVEAFVRRDTSTTEDAVVSKWYGGDQFLLTLLAGGNGRLRFLVRGAGGGTATVQYDLPDLVYLGEWVHVAATYDGAGNLRLYWNGALVASQAAPISGLWAGRQPIRVGDANNAWSRFDGAIDEVKIWGRVLGAAELARPLKPRVLVVEYDSPLSERYDPRDLSEILIRDVESASRYARFEITEWIETGIHPPQRAGNGFHYALLFATYGLCDRLREGQIHEVWVWAGPEGGLLEWAVNGPWREAYGRDVGIPNCGVPATVMGFNYEREIGEAGESFAHRLENAYQFWWGKALWDRFDGQQHRYGYTNENQPPLVRSGTHCGNAHFPPNADLHYEFTSPDVVYSNCADWRADGGGNVEALHCATWGCSHQGFNLWWMSNMPGALNRHGAQGARLKNWWTALAQ